MVVKRKRKLPRLVSTKITKGGQITLPAEAREALGVKPGDSVEVRIDNGSVTVLKPKYTLKDVLGKLPPPRPGYNIDEALRGLGEEIAEDAIRKMQTGRG